MSASANTLAFSGAATLVGSLPHKDRHQALSLIFEEMREIPLWPQLSAYPMEQMMLQYTEGLPGLILKNNQASFVTENRRFEDELLSFYEEYLAVTGGEMTLRESRFPFGIDSGRTFFSFIERLAAKRVAAVAIKGQTLGPFTLLAGLKKENNQLALYDSRLRDVVIKTLALKAQWQVEQLSQFSRPVIIFIDEPALAGFGSSAFISVAAEEVTTMLAEVASHIHRAGGLAGVHVCGNTDWSLFFNSSLDVINFDAYTYFDRFALYRQDIARFVNRGGIVAWGIVPTMNPENIDQENVDSLSSLWHRQVECLAGDDLPLETIFSRSLITPSCGCGSLRESLAERVVRLTRQVSKELRQQFSN